MPDQPGQLQSWQVQKCGGFLAWFKGGTPPGFWTTTASVLLQVIEMKGDAKDTPVDQGVDHVDHPWHKDAGGPGTLVFISPLEPFRAILNPECDAALEGRQSRYLGNFQEFPQPLLLAGGVRP